MRWLFIQGGKAGSRPCPSIPGGQSCRSSRGFSWRSLVLGLAVVSEGPEDSITHMQDYMSRIAMANRSQESRWSMLQVASPFM